MSEEYLCLRDRKTVRRTKSPSSRLDTSFVLTTPRAGGCDSAAGGLGISHEPKRRQSILTAVHLCLVRLVRRPISRTSIFCFFTDFNRYVEQS